MSSGMQTKIIRGMVRFMVHLLVAVHGDGHPIVIVVIRYCLSANYTLDGAARRFGMARPKSLI
jgi:hypothetical protein